MKKLWWWAALIIGAFIADWLGFPEWAETRAHTILMVLGVVIIYLLYGLYKKVED